jgi:mannose-6-phosphate isomerase-like protein (cupin superfamily)
MKQLTKVLVLVGVFFLSAARVSFSQFTKETAMPVVDVSAKEVAAILGATKPGENSDQSAVITDAGDYNIIVNVQHRVDPQGTGPGGIMRFHSKITEIYYVISGSGDFVTAVGPISNVKPDDYNKGAIYKTVETGGSPDTGPGGSANFAGPPKTRRLGPGDIVVIPPYTGHYLSTVQGHIDYISFRVDPGRTMPDGYVNPVLKKLGRAKP